MRLSIPTHRLLSSVVSGAFVVCFAVSSAALPQNVQRSPSETVREFYKAMREKRFREAFALSIYKPAIEGLSQKEYDDLLPDFEKTAIAVTERIPEKLEVSGEQISGDTATVFVTVLDNEGKEKIEPATLIKVNEVWILGDRENQELVKKAGKQFFFDARINTHHNDVQDMLTRISLAQVVYSQQHAGQFGDMPGLIAAGLVPKDIEGTASTGYRFRITVSPDRKAWSAAAEPEQYGRTGKLSFFLDASGARSGDVGGKPLPASPLKN
ncbi:MAG: DUF4878 domain-containing protein [Pyrinomonadaceae bacterium]